MVVNKLCSTCMCACKQESGVKIVRCPNYRKRLSEDEFNNLIHELDAAETRAADLKRRVKDLIEKALSPQGSRESESPDDPGPAEAEPGGSGTEEPLRRD
jgi:hypothetical protein